MAKTSISKIKDDSPVSSDAETASLLLHNKTICIFGDFEEKSSITSEIQTLGGKVVKYTKGNNNNIDLFLAKDVTHVPDHSLDKKVYSINYIHKLAVSQNVTELDLEDFRLSIDEGLENRISEASAMVATALAAQKGSKGKSDPIPDALTGGDSFENSKKIVGEDGTVYTITGSIYDLNYDILADLPTISIVQPPKKQAAVPTENADNAEIVRKTVSRKFTKEEDEYLLQLIRRYPHFRGTHSFYQRIAQLPFFSSHTGNSIRFRFRKILQPQLEFVYEVDPKTNQVKFHPGTDIPIKNLGQSNLLKSQYTAEEDYLLCKAIQEFREGLKDNQSISASKKKGGIIPEAIFKNLSEINPRHSLMSYRDRYRKFAAVYGIKDFIDYYDECIQEGRVPEPMKNLSSRAQRTKRTRYEGIDAKSIERTEELLKKALSNVDKTNEDEVNPVPTKKYKVSKAKAEVVADAPEVLATLAEESVKRQQLAASAATATATAAAAVAIDTTPKEPTNIFEVAEEAQKALGEQIELEDSHSKLPSALQKTDPVYDASKAKVKDIKALNFSRNEKKEYICNTISTDFGFSAVWLNHWYDCCNGDLTTLKEVLTQYLETRKVSLINDAHYWTKEYDLLLNDIEGNEKKLHSLYTDADIKKRIKYLASL